jgi:hypothetical protein
MDLTSPGHRPFILPIGMAPHLRLRHFSRRESRVPSAGVRAERVAQVSALRRLGARPRQPDGVPSCLVFPGGEGRIRTARFSSRKSLEEFDFGHAQDAAMIAIPFIGRGAVRVALEWGIVC